MKTQATLVVDGPRQLLRAYRKRVREELKADAPEVRLTEQQENGAPQFTLDAPDGIPFPLLVDISMQYPECVARVRWRQDGAQGETTIQNGQVKEASRSGATGPAGGQPQMVRVEATEGILSTLALGLVIDLTPAGIAGFCATSEAETYFKICSDESNIELLTIRGETMEWDECWRAGAGDARAQATAQAHATAQAQATEPAQATARALSPAQALTTAERRTLDRLAAQFRAEWLWYDHAPLEDTAVERQRYAEAGRPVRAINVKSRQLAEKFSLPACLSTSTLDTSQTWIAILLAQTWARPE